MTIEIARNIGAVLIVIVGLCLVVAIVGNLLSIFGEGDDENL